MISGEKVGLRAIEFQDLAKLLEWRNQPELRRFFRERRELNWHHQNAWFGETVLKDPTTRMFSIVRLSDGMLLGACGLCRIDWTNASAEISLYIGDGYIDKEAAPDAARLLINHAFRELRLHRLWVEVYDFDQQKKILLMNLGFHCRGVFPDACWRDGRWYDSMIYCLLEHEFK